ncbi:MAG: hypothetical protein JWM81_431 [Candidatus Saccharibacteria bacterium]|nr:hypothetical protein [Candidatus Saccharibacteria bacterium]
MVVLVYMFKTFMAFSATGLISLFAASPASTNFTLRNYDFGTGGGSSSSSSYALNGTSGSQTGASATNGITILKPGEQSSQTANVPPAATLSNPANTYNKLHLVINNGSNPTDTKFAIAISSDGFATTKYIQNDNSVGAVLGIEDYQTYALWGSSTGIDVLGLLPSTTYTVKVSALQGGFTGSAFGPVSTGVATAAPSVSFAVATTANATPPFTVGFTSLAPNSVFSANAGALVSVSTNAVFGGGVYIKDTSNGLFSTAKNSTISSATADLTAAASGYGGQITSLSQASGGPLTASSPYNGSANNVGALSTSLQQLFGTTGPVTTGSGQITFMAKTTSITPASTDYSDKVTIITAMSF